MAYKVCKAEESRNRHIERAKDMLDIYPDEFERLHTDIRYHFEKL